jgi:uncharacterized membrane protein
MGIFKTKQLATAGLMAALVMVGTMIIQVPTPAKGYIHIGDSLVYLSGVLLGPLLGALAAAVGSTLADLFSGYSIYAPATFVIKGLDALIVGYCYHTFTKTTASLVKKFLGFILSFILGGSIMVGGYLAFETFLYGFPTAVLSMVANITQAVGGGFLALPLILSLEKLHKQ